MSATPKRGVLITGATGSLGNRLCRAFYNQGWRVRALDLDRARWDALQGVDVEPVHGDVAETRVVARAAHDVHAVVNCAALLPDSLHLGRPAFLRTNVQGCESVLKAAHENGISRAIFISSAPVLAASPNGVTADDGPYRKVYDHYAWSKIEAEKRLVELSRKLRQPAMILRPTFVYGRGMRFRWLQLARLVQARRMLVFNDGRAPLPLIHVDDLVRAVMHAVEAPPAADLIEKVIIASGEDTRIGDVVDFMSDYYGTARCRRVPAWPFHALAALVQLCPNAVKTERMRLVNRDSVAMYSMGYRFDTTKARALLGFESRIPFAVGMKEMLDSFGELS